MEVGKFRKGFLGEDFELGHKGSKTSVWSRHKARKLMTGIQTEPNPGFKRKEWTGDPLGKRRRKVLL